MTSELVPVALKKNPVLRELEIEWSDGMTFGLPYFKLRKACPCATCTEKHGPRPQPPAGQLPVLSAAAARPMDIVAMEPAGNYGYRITFSDGHNSGIFSIDVLRMMGEMQSAGKSS